MADNQSTSTPTGQASTPAPATDLQGTTPADPQASGGSGEAGDDKSTALGGKGKDSSTSGGDSGEPGGPAPDVPIEISLPENVSVDKKMLDKFIPIAKEVGLNSETATKVAEWYAEQVQAATQAQDELFAQQDRDWVKSLEDDPEFGGQNLKANVAHARKGIDVAGGDELRAEIDRLGIGNNPILTKAFAKIGKHFSEDNSGGPSSGSPPNKKSDKEVLDEMFPTTAVSGGA